MRVSPLHRCTECGTIAEWHYILVRDPNKGTALMPAFRQAAGSKAFAAGQGVIGNQPHVVNPDFSKPLHPETLRPIGAVDVA